MIEEKDEITPEEIEELKNEIKHRMSDENEEPEEEEITPEEMAEEIQQIESEEELEEYLEENHSVDIAESFEELDDEDLLRVFELMSDEQKASIVEQADEDLQKRVFELIDDEEAIDILGYMSPDDIADILGYIDIQKSKTILTKMKRSQANKIRELLGYEEDSAGGIMTTQYIAFKENLEIKDVISKIKVIAPKTEVIETIFVINDKKELVGEADLRDILIAADDTKLIEIMNENVIWVNAEEDQEDVARLVSKYDLRVVPVVNKKKKLLGIITIDDIIDVIHEENTEDILKLGGASDEEDVYSEFTVSVKKRLLWLTINLGTAFLAAFTVGIFSNTIDKVVALAATMPIVSGMGGNAGTQSLSITIRALALGEIDMKDTLKIVLKNFLVGAVNGSILGILCGIVMYALYQNAYLGVIIFMAMIGNLVLACITGFLIPITLKAVKIDPAMASAVILTTVTDVFGFFLFLGLATLFLDKLV
ncbi:magnesium transporter [Leptotrichia sp. OH3620_COT-345]|uniref:magnesium transporter n=1 Tax=Leptotrichia sp. OH3620_COT-345 TaxID=2491048 RepID=UPI000F651493|nr:magnesium transporter [Leptotrichia sp. OH3620_COT-345]RRD39522.1 magnesium transporter [Leptotrichia sp. OH3620_COT-345]